MVGTIQALERVGQFDAVAPGANLPFSRMTFIYAENGRGKTTLAAILRSLKSGASQLITDRQRLGSADAPRVVIDAFGGGQHVFENGTWDTPLVTLAVFDDAFVAENVCSGIEIEAGHRQNLHELILGEQGVQLNHVLKGHVDAIEEHNRQLRLKEAVIPGAARFGFSADDFCGLQTVEGIDGQVQAAEMALAAGQSTAAIQSEAAFETITLPAFDVDAINAVLGRDLPQLDAAAAAQVQAHLASLGVGAERWVNDGVSLLSRDEVPWPEQDCPFCAQPLSGSELIERYRAYFGAEYTALKLSLQTLQRNVTNDHGGDVPAAFERAVAAAAQRKIFWQRFLEVPEFQLDTAQIARGWKLAREKVLAAVAAKQAAPLDPLALDGEAIAAIDEYKGFRTVLEGVSHALTERNGQIAIVKERSQSADVATLTSDLNRLNACRSRYQPAIAARCDDYAAEKAAKQQTEAHRAAARNDLDNYRQNIFPTYQDAINNYLGRFNAGFRLNNVGSVNNRGGSSAIYSVVINNVNVPLTAEDGPSFRTTLSAGDRNTLALAFFFASLDQDQALADKIVIIDDPITSLDEHRSLVTVQEIRSLRDRVRQIIVLSHSKPFLISMWKSAPANDRTAIRISRAAVGSILEVWDINRDSITEHDRRYGRVSAYVVQADPGQERNVAADLRPMLEAFLRVAYPGNCPPGTMLGHFIQRCQQRVGTADEILRQTDITELNALRQYANRFHHDTNPAYETEHVNPAELTNFADRTLRFMRRA